MDAPPQAAPPLPPAPAATTLLLRFGELTLKSHAVRRRFTQILRSNIETAFVREGLDCLIRDDFGHLYVDTSDISRAVPLLQRTFGLTSLSPVATLRSSDLGEVAPFLAAFALENLPPEASTFAVRARRTGSHPYSSMDLGRVCGSAIFEAAAASGRHLSVDLSKPDFEVEVEVRENRTYAYARRVPCPGGLPVGTAGKVLFVLRGGKAESDLDARAAWMLIKRGAQPVFLAEGDEATRTPSPHAAAALRRLAAWTPSYKVLVASDPLDGEAVARLAREVKAHAVAVGTRAKAGAIAGPVSLAGPLPTFHPLLALTDAEVAQIPLG